MEKRSGVDPAAVTDQSPKSERSEFMKRSLLAYDVTVGAARMRPTLLAEPSLRWDNQVSKVPDGSLYLWTDAESRPVIAVQVFIAGGTKDLWLHEFQSLTAEPLQVVQKGKPIWTPRRGGIALQPVSDAPPPSQTRPGRLSQMKQIAQRYKAEDEFEEKSAWELRLLSTPVHRWEGKSGSTLIDGALFVYVHGTDPEALLFLEAQRTPAGEVWKSSFAPMTGYALKIREQDRPVWSISKRMGPYDPNEPFICLPVK